MGDCGVEARYGAARYADKHHREYRVMHRIGALVGKPCAEVNGYAGISEE